MNITSNKMLDTVRKFFLSVNLEKPDDALCAELNEFRAKLIRESLPIWDDRTPPDEMLKEILDMTTLSKSMLKKSLENLDEETMEAKDESGNCAYVDVIEEYLDSNGLTYPDEERDEAKAEDVGAAIIYGTRYSELLDELHGLLLADQYNEVKALHEVAVAAYSLKNSSERKEAMDAMVKRFDLRKIAVN